MRFEDPVRVRTETLPLIALVSCVSILSILTVIAAIGTEIVFEPSIYLPIHTSVEIFTISVSMGIFCVRWLSRRLVGDAQSLFIGAAFLSVGLIHLFHVLVFPGMPEFLAQDQMQVAIYFWMFGRFTFVVSLLVATFLPNERTLNTRRRFMMLSGFCFYTIFVFLLVGFGADSLPKMYNPETGLTPLKIGLEYAIIFLLIITTIRYLVPTAKTRELSYTFITIALILGVFEELSFTLYASAFDSFNLMGHIFGFFSFVFVFFSLFRLSVIRPYSWLRMTKKQLERERTRLTETLEELVHKTEESETAKRRAQFYFDFMAHDISNMISPILPYAELISSDNRIPSQRKQQAELIIKQVQQAGDFIVGLKELSNAETISPTKTTTINLKEALFRIESTIRERHPQMDLNIVYDIPPAYRPITLGGEYIEKVLHEIMEHIMRYGHVEDRVLRMTIKIERLKRPKTTQSYWQILMAAHDCVIPPNVRRTLDEILDPERRYRRGVATNFSFYASIVNYFGGRMRIDDISSENESAGSVVMIELPMIENDYICDNKS